MIRSTWFLVAASIAVAVARSPVAAQGNCVPAAGGPSQTSAAQPRVIVIPYVKQDEDLRKVIEADFSNRLALAKVKEAFDKQHFATIDAIGALRMVDRSSGLGMGAEQDFRTRLIEASQADIYVIANFQPQRTGGLLSVTLILNAYLTANGMALGDKVGRSTRNQVEDTTAHVEQAAGDLAPELIAVMQDRFCEFQKEGVPLSVELRVAEGSSRKLTTPVPGKADSTIADVLEEWLRSHAYNNVATFGNADDFLMQVPEVRVALRDARGQPMSARRFSSDIARFLRTIGVSASPTLTNGAIYVQIQ